MHMHIHIPLQIENRHTYICTYMHACMHSCMYICTYIHTYVRMYVHTASHYITLHSISLHCITLHWIALHCIALHYITQYVFTCRHTHQYTLLFILCWAQASVITMVGYCPDRRVWYEPRVEWPAASQLTTVLLAHLLHMSQGQNSL